MNTNITNKLEKLLAVLSAETVVPEEVIEEATHNECNLQSLLSAALQAGIAFVSVEALRVDSASIADGIRKSVEERLVSLREKVRVVKAIRKGVDKVKHHAKFTRRVQDAVKAALVEEFGGNPDSILVSSGGYSLYNLNVWGVGGLRYDNRLVLGFNLIRPHDGANAPTWQEELEKNLAREDCSDVIEDLENKLRIVSGLAWIEADLKAAKTAATERMDALLALVPSVPSCATLRRKSVYWSELPGEFSKHLPLLTGSK